MARNFAEIAFSESVKAQQEKHGSRRSYAKVDAMARGTELGTDEAEFIGARDSFYLSTIGASGYPYVQFRGGPPGFLKIRDPKTLAFADFRGNRQYVSVGNLQQNDKAALIMVDYANRQRLKIFARVEAVDADAAPELIAQLQDPAYEAEVERAMILHVEAFDWNCPQHITPRYTIDEVRALSAPISEYISKLEAEIRRLKST